MKKNSTIFYFEARTKYDKFYLRLQKNITSGAFWKFTVAKRNMLVKRLAQLKKKLEVLNPQWSVALATGALALVMGANTAVAQPFVKQTGTNNPVAVVSVSSSDYTAPALADLDNDGDLDLIVGDYNEFLYYKNTGTRTAPVFSVQTGTNNPLNNLAVDGYISPSLGDIDGDGDYDLITGGDLENLYYYKNTGTKTAPVFVLQTGTNSVLPTLSTTLSLDELSPKFVDIDGDGDLDVLSGEEDYQSILFFQNTGTKTAPNLVFTTTTVNPFSGVSFTARTEPTFGDVDGDGDYDAIIGVYDENVYYENTGTKTSPVFTLRTGTNSPFNGVSATYGYFSTALADIDYDGDMDFFAPESSSLAFYKNQDPTPPPVATSIIGGNNVNNISSQVSLYPNPTKNVINFSVENEILSNVEVTLMDASGAEVKKAFFTSSNGSLMTMDISELNEGIYMLNLKSEDKVATVKVVKQ